MDDHDEQTEVGDDYKPLSTYLHDIQIILKDLTPIRKKLMSMTIALWILVCLGLIVTVRFLFWSPQPF